MTGANGVETTVDVTGDCPPDGAADLWTIQGGGHIPNLTPTFGTELTTWVDGHPR